MNKIYVKEIRRKNADGDWLVQIQTYKSKPKKPNYIVWI